MHRLRCGCRFCMHGCVQAGLLRSLQWCVVVVGFESGGGGVPFHSSGCVPQSSMRTLTPLRAARALGFAENHNSVSGCVSDSFWMDGDPVVPLCACFPAGWCLGDQTNINLSLATTTTRSRAAQRHPQAGCGRSHRACHTPPSTRLSVLDSKASVVCRS